MYRAPSVLCLALASGLFAVSLTPALAADPARQSVAASATDLADPPDVADPVVVPWMPVEVGIEKIFVHREDTRLSAEGTSLGEESMVGTREERIMPAPAEHAAATAEIRVTTRLSGELGEQVEIERMFVSPTPSAYLVHATHFDLGGERFLMHYPKPAVALVEGARPGEKWHVSTEELGGLRGDTWGEVVGLQDARTPAGLFEKCLVVRYTGTVEGTFEVPGAGAMEIVDGKVVLTEWHAKGIGLVLAKETLSQKLRAKNGVSADTTITSQTALKEVRRAALARHR